MKQVAAKKTQPIGHKTVQVNFIFIVLFYFEEQGADGSSDSFAP